MLTCMFVKTSIWKLAIFYHKHLCKSIYVNNHVCIQSIMIEMIQGQDVSAEPLGLFSNIDISTKYIAAFVHHCSDILVIIKSALLLKGSKTDKKQSHYFLKARSNSSNPSTSISPISCRSESASRCRTDTVL